MSANHGAAKLRDPLPGPPFLFGLLLMYGKSRTRVQASHVMPPPHMMRAGRASCCITSSRRAAAETRAGTTAATAPEPPGRGGGGGAPAPAEPPAGPAPHPLPTGWGRAPRSWVGPGAEVSGADVVAFRLSTPQLPILALPPSLVALPGGMGGSPGEEGCWGSSGFPSVPQRRAPPAPPPGGAWWLSREETLFLICS
ncbi:hypothetical protein GHT09_000427 [Marmota monax]|uniref:Uncharacterized protein n=1 Tax=Marmota monax TaxID=9995 RepID=A0A834QX17_MARMO|nr:hypothetical protein GHT09_000427 [Marmota monax]